MSQATLASQLLAVDPEIDEVDAAENFAEAYRVYALAATASVPILPAGPAAGKVAMKSALIGMSSPGAAAGGLSSAISSFWSAAIPTGFPAASASVPQSGSMPGLQSTFNSNTNGSLTKAQATAAFAADMHSASSGAGGTVTIATVVHPIV